MQISILILAVVILMVLVYSVKIIKLHIEDLDDEMHTGFTTVSKELTVLTENLDEFEFERGLKKWHHMGARSRNKYIAEHYLGWANLGNEWHDRNGEVYDEPSDFEGENFSKFVHEVKLSDKDRQFLLYCILWQKGFKL